MNFGVHLPLIAFNEDRFSLMRLLAFADAAESLGFQTLSVNDHLLFSRPWLDGPTALATVLSQTQHMALATTVALPVVRGPVALAKTLAALNLLSGGRLVVGVGPGSSTRDYAAVGIPFEERWKRLEEAVQVLRTLWRKDSPTFKGHFYTTEGVTLEPYPAQPAGPPIWIGSWGSAIGLRRTARLGDGWLASAYNTTPEMFTTAWSRLRELLADAGKNPNQFPNALATMFFHVTDNASEADRVIRNVLGPTLNRPEDELRQRLLIGSARECAEKLIAYREAGVQQVLLWPVADEVRQLEIFQERVAPLAA